MLFFFFFDNWAILAFVMNGWLIITTAFSDSSFTPNGETIHLEISNVTNPDAVFSTDYLTLATLTSDWFVID